MQTMDCVEVVQYCIQNFQSAIDVIMVTFVLKLSKNTLKQVRYLYRSILFNEQFFIIIFLGHEKIYCEKCGTTIDKTYLQRHLRIVHEGKRDYKCEHCGKEYADKKGLSTHIKSSHDNVRDEQCNQCGKLFFTKEVLRQHIKNIHNKEQNPRFKCEYCQKSYTQKSYFKIHQHTIHGI